MVRRDISSLDLKMRTEIGNVSQAARTAYVRTSSRKYLGLLKELKRSPFGWSVIGKEESRAR